MSTTATGPAIAPFDPAFAIDVMLPLAQAAYDVARGRSQLLDIQSAARPFAQTLKSVLGAQPYDRSQEDGLVHPVMIEQRRVGAGYGCYEHLADAQGCAHLARIAVSQRWPTADVEERLRQGAG